MLEKSLGVLFFLKRPKNQKQNERYVYLRITVNGTPKELSTKRVWYPDRWTQATGRATGTKEDAKNLNNYLDTLLLKVHQAKGSLLESDREITADELKNIISGKGEETQWFVQVIKRYKDRI